MRFVVVTGMSGGGKKTALRMLEDIGFYCVDNLPVDLIEKFVELLASPGGEITKVALGVDVRANVGFERVPSIFSGLKKAGYPIEILYMEASDETLLKRYKETRRMHPLSPEGRLEEGINKERTILKPIKEQADYIMDSSKLLTRDLKEELDRIFVRDEGYKSLMVTIMSFGFKHGMPQDADLVFDVRFLPNPYYIDELKHFSGNDACVRDYVMSFDEANIFLDKLVDMVEFLMPNYVKEGKYQLVIAIGCTGGKHRSVTLANALHERLKSNKGYGLKCYHRDIDLGIHGQN
ncbi:MAG: RNase adapter RapZ [Lachnospiraceae bacterium]|nr:RNase adapter RapZ [Lachnospiraceae bacterium]